MTKSKMNIPNSMKAMVLKKQGTTLELTEIPMPEPNEEQVLIRVHACGVCRTDLHIVDSDLKEPKLPLILGHEIVGEIVKTGKNVSKFKIGDRVGVPWLGNTCGKCKYCISGKENLCENAKFTGYTKDGGYAEYTAADQRYCFKIPVRYTDKMRRPCFVRDSLASGHTKCAAKNLKHLAFTDSVPPRILLYR